MVAATAQSLRVAAYFDTLFNASCAVHKTIINFSYSHSHVALRPSVGAHECLLKNPRARLIILNAGSQRIYFFAAAGGGGGG